ncbi:DUF308 domain-containing protein [Methanobrevibacter sp.]|uniref:DUF308 domain-containing protein n=1 Tax=Methanobrevibacter sp. TaxID=66852 RepID=UPI00388E485A
MIREKIIGLLYILFGIIFIVSPVVSSDLLSICIGFSLVCLGLAEISVGFLFTNEFGNNYAYLSIIIGIISLIFGIIFMFYLNALTFLISLQFYIIAILMMVYGIVGAFYLEGKYKIYSIIILILGILVAILAAFLASQPILIAILLGVALIIEGVFVLVIDRAETLIEKYE